MSKQYKLLPQNQREVWFYKGNFSTKQKWVLTTYDSMWGNGVFVFVDFDLTTLYTTVFFKIRQQEDSCSHIIIFDVLLNIYIYISNGQQHSSDYDPDQNTYGQFGISAPLNEVFKGNVWNICIHIQYTSCITSILNTLLNNKSKSGVN